MKIYISILLLFIISSFALKAQQGVSLDELYLKGKWKGTCPIEILSRVSIQSCPLCDFKKDPKNSHAITPAEIDLDFRGDSLEISQQGNVSVVKITRNKDDHSFMFSLNGEDHTFRVFFDDFDNRIIEDKDGLLIILKSDKSSK